MTLSTVAPLAVLLDLNMPGIGGTEALKEIRARHRYLPVIVFTSEREVQTVVDVMQQGAYDFLPKPLAQNKLLTTVRNAVTQHDMTVRVLELEAEGRPRGIHGSGGRFYSHARAPSSHSQAGGL